MKHLYIVYAKDEYGLCAHDIFVSDSKELAINKFKEEHSKYDNFEYTLIAQVIDECDGYKVLVEENKGEIQCQQ